MARSMLSAGTSSLFAAARAFLSGRFDDGSPPPPSRTAVWIARMCLLMIFPRALSLAAFLRLIWDHLLCPANWIPPTINWGQSTQWQESTDFPGVRVRRQLCPRKMRDRRPLMESAGPNPVRIARSTNPDAGLPDVTHVVRSQLDGDALRPGLLTPDSGVADEGRISPGRCEGGTDAQHAPGWPYPEDMPPVRSVQSHCPSSTHVDVADERIHPAICVDGAEGQVAVTVRTYVEG